MNLDELYHLRKDFTIIGLTGRISSGCTEVARRLTAQDYDLKLPANINPKNLIDPEKIKINICQNYLKENWKPFTVINYDHILLLHLIYEAINSEDFHEYFFDIFFQNGSSTELGKKISFKNRFDPHQDASFKTEILDLLKGNFEDLKFLYKEQQQSDLHDFLENFKLQCSCSLIFENFFKFSEKFYDTLHRYDITKKNRLVHDLANSLRRYNTVKNLDLPEHEENLDHIYTIATTINYLIKIWRNENKDNCKIVIDSLKNSLELSFFKEKFSAFYMIAVKKNLSERNVELKDIIRKFGYSEDQIEKHLENIISLDDNEYKGDDVNSGRFAFPDIENCIQKSEYHLFFSKIRHGQYEGVSEDKSDSCDNRYKYLGLDVQLIKLIALIHQPGIVTPTAIERTMQIAFNAKYNSGCISRQVGAVITDDNFRVKAIGWNDVAQGQIPCSLRNIKDLESGENKMHFSDFELGKAKDTTEDGLEGTNDFKYKDGSDFKSNVVNLLKSADMANLEGKTCSFCFKSFHNSFEGEKNQVHTRSLHAEENAMMQIAKYGGNQLLNGYLFTTASPCELCSKKAFQLGIQNIYYIDPYPGIASKHTLKNGVNPKSNPKLIMFQGAIGKTFHKIYEPFLSYKDELSILTKIKPKANIFESIRKLGIDQKKLELIEEILNK